MQGPVLIKQIPSQGVNERAAFGPFDLKEFINAPDGSAITFQAEISDGASLPKGMICTSDGIVTGIPAKDTRGNYEIIIHARNEGGSLDAKFVLSIQPNLADANTKLYVDELKQQIWQALDKNIQAPEIAALMELAVTPLDVYYLLERWGTLTIYDAFNLEPPGEKNLLVLEGASEHFVTYDRGSCLVACPKELFSHERTLADGLRTAEALAREAYKRNWTVELIGFEKYTRAAWVEIQHLGQKNNRKMEILNYEPTNSDMRLQQMQAREMSARKTME
jgi:hypothetical protein